jgi:hypothetical protein
MKGKIKVSIPDTLGMIKKLNEIDLLSIDDIEFIDSNGEIIEVDKNRIEEYKQSGLLNTDFIGFGYYK